MASLPTLVVVSGPIGAGKTTLAHQLARAVGCPAICRDEIKEGMAHSSPGFVPAPGDELTMRTLPVFFDVLELLLRAGVTTVAEAAFQDHVWRPRLEPLRGLASLRIVHCVVGDDAAFRRVLQRDQDNPVRRAHADPRRSHDVADFARHRSAFDRVSVEAPWMQVDTTDGYQPGFDEIVRFVNSPAQEQALRGCTAWVRPEEPQADQGDSSMGGGMGQQPGPLGADAAVTHILVVAHPAASRDFWVNVLGAELYREYGGTSVVLKFAGTWLLLVSGGGPTADKPRVTFAPPPDPDQVSHAITVRVADCRAAYAALTARGAAFLTAPHDWGGEIRCFLRDPDGHLVEISESVSA